MKYPTQRNPTFIFRSRLIGSYDDHFELLYSHRTSYCVVIVKVPHKEIIGNYMFSKILYLSYIYICYGIVRVIEHLYMMFSLFT